MRKPTASQCTVGRTGRCAKRCYCAIYKNLRPVAGKFVSDFPEVARLWHPDNPGSPETTAAGSKKLLRWLCPLGHVSERHPKQLCQRAGAMCPGCNPRTRGARTLQSEHPDVAAQWHPTRNGALTPADVGPRTTRKVWFQCPAHSDHEYEAQIANRSRAGNGCPFCSGQRLTPERTLRARHPETAAEWHPTRNGDLTPDDVSFAANRRVWFQCLTCGHETDSLIPCRTRSGCPECSIRHAARRGSIPEIRLREALVPWGFEPDPARVYGFGHRWPWKVDAAHLADQAVVEFDGTYWHGRDPEAIERDARKAASLMVAGWTVIRVRQGLDLIGPHDIRIDAACDLSNPADVERVVAHVARVLNQARDTDAHLLARQLG